MELLKEVPPLEYVFKDVTFVIRAQANAHDKFQMDMSLGQINGEGKVEATLREVYQTLIKLFVVGWKGVTQDGKEVPYSYDLLTNAFPADPMDDVYMRLGGFIASKTGILPAPDSVKNA